MRFAVLLLAGCSLGCFSPRRCKSEELCPPPEPDACEGVCAPFVGGFWSPVLVASSSPRPRCPSVAPVQATATSSMTACGVPEADGECSEGLVCLAAEPGWSVCIVRDGAHACPLFYEAPVQAEQVTLCCPDEEPVP